MLPLACVLTYIIYPGPLFCTFGCNIVYPNLEYASQVWNPYKVEEANPLEHVQKFVLHMCAKPWDTSYHLAVLPTRPLALQT